MVRMTSTKVPGPVARPALLYGRMAKVVDIIIIECYTACGCYIFWDGAKLCHKSNPTISKTIILAACKAKWLGERKNISPNNKAAVEFFIKRAFLKRNGESEAVRSREDHASGDNHREGPKV